MLKLSSLFLTLHTHSVKRGMPDKIFTHCSGDSMIEGIGVDIIEIERIRTSIERFGSTFLQKLFTDSEIEYCNTKKNPVQHFAARFAAKEAVSKALATGWGGEFQWKNVEVVNDLSGKPNVKLYGSTANALRHSRVLLSLSHSDTSVVAFAVIEKKE